MANTDTKKKGRTLGERGWKSISPYDVERAMKNHLPSFKFTADSGGWIIRTHIVTGTVKQLSAVKIWRFLNELGFAETDWQGKPAFTGELNPHVDVRTHFWGDRIYVQINISELPREEEA